MTKVIIESDSPSQVRPLIQAAVDHEVRVLKMGLEKTKGNLQKFEERFGMESQKFYQEFQAGELGDSMDYIKWAGEYETLLELQKDYAEIEEIQVC